MIHCNTVHVNDLVGRCVSNCSAMVVCLCTVINVNEQAKQKFCLPKAANKGWTSDIKCPSKMTKCPPKADSGQTKDWVVSIGC